MNMLALIPAVLLPAFIGWAAVNIAERGQSLLSHPERIGWSLILGPTLSMLIVFLLAAAGVTRFSATGFLIPIVALAAILGAIAWGLGVLRPPNAPMCTEDRPLRPWMRIGILLLGGWTILKLCAGMYDLVSVPTYWDDSFNNWNMRGKIFYETQQPVLEIPIGNGLVAGSEGVSSYPPTLPLLKTWAAVIRGAWTEPLANGVQLVWTVGLLLAFYGLLRRSLGGDLSIVGVYLLISLPIVLIQSTNPYAEIMVAGHLLLAVSSLAMIIASDEQAALKSALNLFSLSTGLLLFTKNEATVLYFPILLLLLSAGIILKHRRGALDARAAMLCCIRALGILLVVAGPWIAFKWIHGLTFGNAKSVGGSELQLSVIALKAVWHHLSHEPNEMFLPLGLVFILTFSKGRALLLRRDGVFLVFSLLAFGLQMGVLVSVRALETEAVMQTGISRGLVQIAPIACMAAIVGSRYLLRQHGHPSPLTTGASPSTTHRPEGGPTG